MLIVSRCYYSLSYLVIYLSVGATEYQLSQW